MTKLPNRRLKRILLLQGAWLALICLLGGWWGTVILRQAERLSKLEGNAEIVSRAYRMIIWEGGTFYLLLLSVSALLVWVYWRDLMRSASLQAFFASLTHELKTPLASIRLQAEAVSESPDHDHSKNLSRLLEDVARLESQVERTLELARVEGGGAVFVQPMSVRTWTDRFLQFWDAGDSIRLKNEIEDIEVLGDAPSLQVILKNLLENSIKHGQNPSVSVSLTSSKVLKGDQSWVLVRYLDSGKSVKTDEKKLGTLFYRGPRSQGAGVGLYLVRALMERMGGRADYRLDPATGGFEANLLFRTPDPSKELDV